MSEVWKQWKVTFGKYQGEILYIIYLNNPQYIEWAIDTVNFKTEQEKNYFLNALNYIKEYHPEKLKRKR